MNINSLKIEGRMKRNEYVGQVVSSYRKAIDSYYDKNIIIDKALEEQKLKLIFNRGFTKGFLFKEKNSLIINSDQPNHIGIVVGKVTKTYPNNTVDIKLIDNISFGKSYCHPPTNIKEEHFIFENLNFFWFHFYSSIFFPDFIVCFFFSRKF